MGSGRRWAVGALAALGVAGGAAPAAHAQARANVSVKGGTLQQTTLCGAGSVVTLANLNQVVRMTAARSKFMRVDKCVNGKWKSMTKYRTKVSGRVTKKLQTTTNADYRIRVGLKAAYVRVGVGEIIDTPISFQVQNVDRSMVPCLPAPDGKTYTVKGSITGPAAALSGPNPVATVYTHGLGYSSDLFFRFKDVPGMDMGAEFAQNGHVSVAIDRLGYGGSQGPDGNAICIGAHADVLHQVIQQLRKGGISIGSAGKTPAFKRIATVGHSLGGFISQAEAYSFKDTNALVVMGFSDSYASPLTFTTLGASAAECLTKPAKSSGGESNFAHFGQTDADFAAGHVYNMDPAVEKILLAKKSLDPCGDILNALPSFGADEVGLQLINVPVYQMTADHDGFFPPPGNLQIGRYLASKDATGVTESDTGHAMLLGRTAPKVRKDLMNWLSNHGF